MDPKHQAMVCSVAAGRLHAADDLHWMRRERVITVSRRLVGRYEWMQLTLGGMQKRVSWPSK